MPGPGLLNENLMARHIGETYYPTPNRMILNETVLLRLDPLKTPRVLLYIEGLHKSRMQGK